jgi:hypothetical protein
VGDAGVRDSLGLNVGGLYNGIDINVGDFITTDSGSITFQIVQIIEKSETAIDLIYEDVWMTIGKSRSDRVNFIPNSSNVIFFTVSDDNNPLISAEGANYFASAQAIDVVTSYFNVYQPFQLFSFYPATGYTSLNIGDLVTSTGGTGEYSLLPVSSTSQTIVGEVAPHWGQSRNGHAKGQVGDRPCHRLILDRHQLGSDGQNGHAHRYRQFGEKSGVRAAKQTQIHRAITSARS